MVWRGGDSTAVADEPTLFPGSPFLAALGRGNLKLCFQERFLGPAVSSVAKFG